MREGFLLTLTGAKSTDNTENLPTSGKQVANRWPPGSKNPQFPTQNPKLGEQIRPCEERQLEPRAWGPHGAHGGPMGPLGGSRILLRGLG